MNKIKTEVTVYEQNGMVFVEVDGRIYVRVDCVQNNIDEIIATLRRSNSCLNQ